MQDRRVMDAVVVGLMQWTLFLSSASERHESGHGKQACTHMQAAHASGARPCCTTPHHALRLKLIATHVHVVVGLNRCTLFLWSVGEIHKTSLTAQRHGIECSEVRDTKQAMGSRPARTCKWNMAMQCWLHHANHGMRV
jgi:hypothetical protein